MTTRARAVSGHKYAQGRRYIRDGCVRRMRLLLIQPLPPPLYDALGPFSATLERKRLQQRGSADHKCLKSSQTRRRQRTVVVVLLLGLDSHWRRYRWKVVRLRG